VVIGTKVPNKSGIHRIFHYTYAIMAFLALSLEELENKIEEYINEGAFMIYWNHRMDIFDYLLESDEIIIRHEIMNLKEQTKKGNILRFKKGGVVDIKGVQLYPMEFEFKDMDCPAYFMVTKRGQPDEMAMTPYFYRSEEECDKIYRFMCKKQT
jgi:hypothetical protein